jgi:hypothetical protein
MGTEVYTLNPNTPGDPHLHTHNIVPNAVVTESGRFVTIHRELFIHRIHEIGGVYQAFLADNLRSAGIEVDLCDRTHMAPYQSFLGRFATSFQNARPMPKPRHEKRHNDEGKTGTPWTWTRGCVSFKAAPKLKKGKV